MLYVTREIFTAVSPAGCISGLTTAQLAIECDESPHAVPVAISFESRRKKSAAWPKRQLGVFVGFVFGKGPTAPVQYSCKQAPGPQFAVWSSSNLKCQISACHAFRIISSFRILSGLQGFTVSFDTRGLGSGRWRLESRLFADHSDQWVFDTSSWQWDEVNTGCAWI